MTTCEVGDLNVHLNKAHFAVRSSNHPARSLEVVVEAYHQAFLHQHWQIVDLERRVAALEGKSPNR